MPHRHKAVRRPGDEAKPCGGKEPLSREGIHHRHYAGMDHLDEHHRKGAKGQGPQQAHPAVDVVPVFAIVPPAGMKQLFHPPGRDILQGAGEDHAGKKEVPGADVWLLPEGQNHRQRPKAVYRAEGTVEEPPVHQGAGGDGAKGGFVHPAQKAV